MKSPIDKENSPSLFGRSSFSNINILTRAVWGLTWLALVSWTPAPFHLWRRFILRLFGAKIGIGARIYGSAKIWLPSNLNMGRYAVLGWGVNCYNQDKITIEDFACVSQYSHLLTGSHNVDSANFHLVTKPILIKKHAWVASNAIVGPGVTIGEGAVLGAGAVTFKNLEDWTIYIGNPCKSIRRRSR